MSLHEAVRYRPGMFIGDSVAQGNVAKIVAHILYDIVCALSHEPLCLAIEIAQASHAKVILKHAVLADNTITDLLNGIDNGKKGIAMLIGLSADCITRSMLLMV